MPGKLRRAAGVVTPVGWSLLLVGVVCFVVTAVGGWPVFRLMWLACGVLVVVSLAIAVVPVRPSISLDVTPPRTTAGEAAEAVLRASSRRRLSLPGPVVNVPAARSPHLVRLRTVRRRRLVEERIPLTGLRRGVIPVGPVTAMRTDPLGLARWTERWSQAAELLVLPRMVPLGELASGVVRDQEGAASDEVSMSDLAFQALREYVPGDELRHVHWRSSAKTGSLQIRQYHDTRRNHVTVVIDNDRASYADEEDFEIAVSTGASIAARADRDGVDLSLLCAHHAVTGRGLDAVLDVCCRIELGASNVTLAAREALRLAPDTSWLVLLSGGAAGDRFPVLRSAMPGDLSVLLVLADGASPTTVSSPAPMTRLVALRQLEDLPGAMRALTPVALT